MKQVLIVSSNRIPYEDSPASARMMNYARALTASGVEVRFFSYNLFDPTADVIEMEKAIFTYPNRDKCKGTISEFFNAIKSAVEDKETSILYYPSFNPAIETLFLFYHKLHLSSIRILRELNEVRIYNGIKPEKLSLKYLLQRIQAPLSDYLSRYYDGLVCISKNILEYAAKYQKPGIVVPILSNSSDSILCREYISGSKGTAIKFMFTGSIVINKENLQELFKGFAKFNKYNTNWSFDLYGYYSNEATVIISKWLAEFGISDKVNFMGKVKQHEIEGILAQADCLILPRKNTPQNYYGFSTKLSEYALAAKPIILADTGVVKQYFTDGENCLMMDGYDADAFCKQFLRFAGLDPAQRRSLGLNAQKTALTDFNWRNYSKQLSDFLFSGKA